MAITSLTQGEVEKSIRIKEKKKDKEVYRKKKK